MNKLFAILILASAPACIDAPQVDSTPVDAGAPKDGVPVACDGALCNTSNGSQCNAGGDQTLLATLAIGLVSLARARRRMVAS